MVSVILAIIIILYILGYITFPWFTIPNPVLFVLFGNPITLWDLLLFFAIATIISILPSPLREVAFIVFILWVLSVLGVIAIAGLANILLVAIIAGLVVFLLSGP